MQTGSQLRSGQLSCSGALTKATRSSSLGMENKFLGIPVSLLTGSCLQSHLRSRMPF
ncbi:rCG25058 [Rattus norvegicus]|uniref:RCG25058 n=1 Tax=Rattus norvegicus TaxID=10116 RepID=A6I281_RAT|nr:rCG25058 [Rattus norvegicus]